MTYERLVNAPQRLDRDVLLARGALELIFSIYSAKRVKPYADAAICASRTAFIWSRVKFLQQRFDFLAQTL